MKASTFTSNKEESHVDQIIAHNWRRCRQCRLGVGSPAFAQAWSNGWGTGNSQPGYFDKDGGMHSGNAPQQLQAVTPGRGLYAFAGHNRGLTGFASIRHPHRGAN
jgi:hypothetical protein